MKFNDNLADRNTEVDDLVNDSVLGAFDVDFQKIDILMLIFFHQRHQIETLRLDGTVGGAIMGKPGIAI